jgi:uncharacterized iron-regulated membrane protein
MSITGAALAFERQIVAWADARAIAQPTAAAGGRLASVDALIDAARAYRSDIGVASIAFSSQRSDPVLVTFAARAKGGDGERVFLDRADAKVLGSGDSRVRAAFALMGAWHRQLGDTSGSSGWGRALTRSANLLFLFIVVSGIYLWIPRARGGAALRHALTFARGLVGRAAHFNRHNVIGFWAFPVLFIVVFSGVVISYEWATNLLYRVVGDRQVKTPPVEQLGELPATTTTDELLRIAELKMHDWRTITWRNPTEITKPAVLTVDAGNGGQPHLRGNLTLDRRNGAVLRWESFDGFSRGRKLRSILRFAHTGEVLGPIGQTLAGLASLAAVYLVWSGLAMSWRRFFAKRRPV